MRTTLDIDDDVLAVARASAARKHISIGRELSALARAALRSTTTGAAPTTRNGLPLLLTTASGRPVTLELVNQLRDELL
jgi:hypothetical protein